MATYEKQLRRLPEQGQITGVCAGLAEYFDLDVTLVRLVFIILAVITGGSAIIGYFLLALILPVGDSASTGQTINISENAKALGEELQDSRHVDSMRNYLGMGLILFGIWLLLGELFPRWLVLRWDFLWPLVLIVIGLIIATRQRR